MRRGGTFTARASAFCDSSIGRRNSSFSISPGCGFGRRSVIVRDFDIEGISVIPPEADAPLIVDADRVLPGTVCFERLEAVGRWNPKVAKALCIVQQAQFPQRTALNFRRQPTASTAVPDDRG